MECLVLTQKEKDKLVAHAREQQPSESCAMLLGKKVGDNWNVKEVFLTQNIVYFGVLSVALRPNYVLIFCLHKNSPEMNVQYIFSKMGSHFGCFRALRFC